MFDFFTKPTPRRDGGITIKQAAELLMALKEPARVLNERLLAAEKRIADLEQLVAELSKA